MINETLIGSSGKLAVEVFGADLDGGQFIEQTKTLKITRDGAIIPLTNKLTADSELIVRNPATNEEAVARVVDLVRDVIFVRVYAVAFIDGPVNLWHTEFPEEQPLNTVTLECDRCHVVESVALSEIEMSVFESKQALTRRCECSTSSTIWKQTDRRVTERRDAVREPGDRRQRVSPVQEPALFASQDRRKARRTAMMVPACIRCGGGEAVVECEDMSRGGFRFKSRKAYPAGTTVEVAVPYARSSLNIFVTARIAYTQELSQGFCRHGVAYVESLVRKQFA